MSHIVSIAGTGVAGYAGDGGPATAAQLSNPFGLAVGPDGALYFCEIDNHCIRRLDRQTGTISTAAGAGTMGYAGDSGPARTASLNQPYEIAFDANGHLFIVEMENHIVRRVDANSGQISTVAGTGEAGFGGDGGPATAAQLRQPHSIALDGRGGLYIADIGNHRIRRVDLSGGGIETFAGTGVQEPTPDGAAVAETPLNGPRALAFEAGGDLIVALREGNAVYRIDMSERRYQHIAGNGAKGTQGDGGPAREAALSGPKGVTIAPDGAIVIADTESHTIRRIDPAGLITRLVGDGTAHDGPDGDPLACGLGRPHGVCVDGAGTLYIGDSENHRVRMVR